MTEDLMEAVYLALEEYPGKDVLLFHERPYLHTATIGLFTWSGYTHTQITLRELREDGWSKEDIKELRKQAVRVLIKEDDCRKFTASIV